ncbi:MAG: hypothetical protein Q8O55_07670 [Dehalococcoidales bacterium]|nr:hypothetical protein [Dehalococcoidales bacterium]
MVCPQCGSRDVVATADVEHGIHFCECDRCGHGWTEKYDPASTPKVNKGDENNAG